MSFSMLHLSIVIYENSDWNIKVTKQRNHKNELYAVQWYEILLVCHIYYRVIWYLTSLTERGILSSSYVCLAMIFLFDPSLFLCQPNPFWLVECHNAIIFACCTIVNNLFKLFIFEEKSEILHVHNAPLHWLNNVTSLPPNFDNKYFQLKSPLS